MAPKKRRMKLSEIIHDREALAKRWKETKPAEKLTPVPMGWYTCRVTDGGPTAARTTNTPGYGVTLEVCDPPEYSGRKLFRTLWLTVDAFALTMREASEIGITEFEQFDHPPPPGLILRARVVLREDNEGGQRNEIREWEFVRVEEPKADPLEIDPKTALADDATESNSGANAPAEKGDHGDQTGGPKG